MAARARDWLGQARRDLEQARHSETGGFHEWACFAAQQGAEKAVKAVLQHAGATAFGHSVTGLLQALPETAGVTAELLDAARELDKHYIPARYPNSHPEGSPHEFYTPADARRALDHGQRIVEFCAGLVAGPG
ncbi:MAG: HEPN domain-containing protein [Gemmatimonadota bacterium]